MAIEHFGKEILHTVGHMTEHLAKENKAHVIVHGGGVSDSFKTAMEFASAHPLLLVAVIAGIALINTITSDD